MQKLLYIEPEEIAGRLYVNRFLEAGYDIELAVDGKSGLSAIARYRPDILVVNFSLPDLSGTELLKEIRSTAETRKTPVIVIAQDPSGRIADVARRAGATRCFLKGSFTDKDLFRAIRDCLKAASEPPPTEARPTEAPETPAGPAAAKPAMAPPRPEPVQPTKSAKPPALQASQWLPHARLKVLAQSFLQMEHLGRNAQLLEELRTESESMAAQAAQSGSSRMGRMTRGLVALVQDLIQRPDEINPSNLRTLNQTIDFLGMLLRVSREAEAESVFQILAVDDAAVARRAIVEALATVDLQAAVAKGPMEALDMLQQQRQDLFILDVNMPEMDGFELCGRLRKTPAHRKTPVIFVTACTDFESRLRFAKTGADDFIGKPFLPSELAVKALRHLFNSQLRKTAPPGVEIQTVKSFTPLGKDPGK